MEIQIVMLNDKLQFVSYGTYIVNSLNTGFCSVSLTSALSICSAYV